MRTTGKQLLCTGAFAALIVGATGCIDATVGEVDVCTYGGKGYSVGERFTATDGCNTCSCAITGEVSCTEIACPDGGNQSSDGGTGQCVGPDGRSYKLGETFKNDCNTCTCTAEGAACTLIGCNPGGCDIHGKHYFPGQPVSEGCGACICQVDGSLACPDIACPNSCMYGGRLYMQGQSFPSTDGCNSCGCSGGQVVCTEKACAGCWYAGKHYNYGDTFADELGCNNCACSEGGVACDLKACGAPTHCNYAGELFGLQTSIPAMDGCNTLLCTQTGWSGTDAACGPVPKIQKCENNPGTLEKVGVLYTTGDLIALEVTMPGCANEGQNFKVCYDGAFRESFPVQADLFVVRETTASCSGLASGARVFDMAPLRQAYQAGYQTMSGTINVTVENGETFQYKF